VWGRVCFVGLSTRRGVDMVMALVAIVKVGAAYFSDRSRLSTGAQAVSCSTTCSLRSWLSTVEAVDTVPEECSGQVISLDDAEVRAVVEASDGAEPLSREAVAAPSR